MKKIIITVAIMIFTFFAKGCDATGFLSNNINIENKTGETLEKIVVTLDEDEKISTNKINTGESIRYKFKDKINKLNIRIKNGEDKKYNLYESHNINSRIHIDLVKDGENYKIIER